MGKRKSESTKYKLMKKLKKIERRMKLISSDSSDEAEEEIEITHVRRSPNKGNDGENDPHQQRSLENILPLAVENDCPNLRDHQPDLEVEDTEENIIEEAPQEELDNQVLEILGVDPQPEKVGEELHKQIAQRWNMILKNGLIKEEKDKIKDENPPFSNLKQIPPLLNPEVRAAVNDASIKRDQLIQRRQNQISTALACLGSCLQMFLKDCQGRKTDIIKKLNDASILLCDSIHLDTKGRRSLLLSVINKDMKDFLLQSETETHLFGEDLAEKIRTAKAVKRSGQELKIAEAKKFTPRPSTWAPRANAPKSNNKTLNWRGPPRAEVKRRGGPPSRATAADRTWDARKNHPRRK